MNQFLTFLLFFVSAFFLSALAERISKYCFLKFQRNKSTEETAVETRLSFRGLQAGIRLLLLITGLAFFRHDMFKLIGIAGGFLMSAKIQMIRLFRQCTREDSGDLKEDLKQG